MITPRPDYDVIVVGGGHNGLVTAGYLARAGRSVLVLEARSQVGGTATSEDFAGADRQRLQLRSHHAADDAGHRRPRPRTVRARVPRPRTERRRSGVVRRSDVDPLARRRPDHRRTRPDPPRRCRRLPALPAAGRAGDHDDPRHGRRAAHAGRTLPDRAPAPVPRTPDGLPLEPAQRGERDARTLHVRGIARVRPRRRTDGVGRQPGARPAPDLGALGYAIRHVARVGRPVGGSRALPEALRAQRRAPRRDGPHRVHRGRDPVHSRPGRRCAARRRNRDHRAGRRVGGRSPAHVRRVARAPTGRSAVELVDRWRAQGPPRTATSRRSMP